jgi:hypothetical protein
MFKRTFSDPNIPCAHCSSSVRIVYEQRRLHLLTDCGCFAHPIICTECRRGRKDREFLNRLTCKWCGKKGFCASFHEKQNLAMNSRWDFEVWSRCQEKYKSITDKSPMIRQYIANWMYLLQVRRLNVTWTPRFDSQNTYSPSNPDRHISNRQFMQGFFRSWIQSQLSQTMSQVLGQNLSQTQWKISVLCFDTILFSGFFRKLKTTTFARLVIRNLFGSCPQTRQTRVLMMRIHARILANFKTLFEISSKC